MIKKDYKGINMERVDAGLSRIILANIQIDYEYTEEEKAENLRMSHELTSDEWSASCDKAWQENSKMFHAYMDELGKVFANIYQYNYFGKDYQIFFYSNRGWNGKDYMTTVQLSLDNCDEQRKNEILNKILEIGNRPEFDHLRFWVKYKEEFDDEKISIAAQKNFKLVEGKIVTWCGMRGRFFYDKETRYRFVKCRVRKYYYQIEDSEMAMIK